MLRIECRHIVVRKASVRGVVERDKACLALGRAVRELRAAQGVSQEELAARSGVHRTYMGGIERGERNPSWSKVLLLADGLGVSAAELVALAERHLGDPA